MAWFILKDQKKRSLRKGICLRVGAIPEPLMALICKHLPPCSLYRGPMSRGQIDWIEISEMLDKGKVRLNVWTATHRDRMAWSKQAKESYQEDSKLVGQVFGKDGMDGDSAFYAPENKIVVRPRDRFKDLLKKWEKNPDLEPDDERPIGFWIIDGKSLKAADAVWGSGPGNDSATYACNRAAKMVCMTLAIRTIREAK